MDRVGRTCQESHEISLPDTKLVGIGCRNTHSNPYFSTAFHPTTTLIPYPYKLYFPNLSSNSKLNNNKKKLYPDTENQT